MARDTGGVSWLQGIKDRMNASHSKPVAPVVSPIAPQAMPVDRNVLPTPTDLTPASTIPGLTAAPPVARSPLAALAPRRAQIFTPAKPDQTLISPMKF